MGTLDFICATGFHKQWRWSSMMTQSVQDFPENFDFWWVADPFPDKLVLEVGKCTHPPALVYRM